MKGSLDNRREISSGLSYPLLLAQSALAGSVG